MDRAELKRRAKEQIKGNIGTLFLCYLIMGLIACTGIGGLLIPALSIGMVTIYFGLTRGEKPTIPTLFSKIDLFGRALWLNILIGIFVYLWTLLLFIPGIIKAISYSLSPYILAERPELTAREALNESKRMTKGHKGEMFVLMLSFFGWGLLCMITFGIAFIYVMPYIQATMINYYNSIKDRVPEGAVVYRKNV